MLSSQANCLQRLNRLTLAAISLLIAVHVAQAQNPVQPKRGFYPAGSYALSDIESINTTNGNVILKIPLASLPAGRGGSAAGVGLYYNSKPYETFSYQEGRFEDGSFSTELRASDAGGWRYGFRYDLQLVNKDQEAQLLHPTCSTNEYYYYNVKMKFP